MDTDNMNGQMEESIKVNGSEEIGPKEYLFLLMVRGNKYKINRFNDINNFS